MYWTDNKVKFNKHTCDYLVDALTKTIKYINGLRIGCIDIPISPCICFNYARDSFCIFIGDGRIINFPWE